MIDSYSDIGGTASYLLDTVTGTCRRLPYLRIQVSPRGLAVAVQDSVRSFSGCPARLTHSGSARQSTKDLSVEDREPAVV